jgi:carboxymethylenebutenolidase
MEDPMGSFETIPVGDTSARLYVAGAGSAESPGVLVLHPWWGLNDDVIAYADRLAGAGFTVAAPDMFGGEVATTIEGAEQLAHAADEEAVNAIVLGALDRLTEGLDASAGLAALGFSFGAHWAIWSPTQRDSVVASVLYYGTTGDNLTDSMVPVLGHFAEDDPYETADWVAEFESILRSAGRDVEIHRYPGTGHWFAEPSRDAYRPEAADLAFERTVAFLRKQFGAGAPIR